MAAIGVSTPLAVTCKPTASATPTLACTHCQIDRTDAEATDESRADLQHVDWQRFQLPQNDVTGTEVIDGDLDAEVLQHREGVGVLDVAQHRVLADLQTQRSCVEAEFVQGGGHAVSEAVTGQ